MKKQEALDLFNKTKHNFVNPILCGSLSLILLGKIEDRDIRDIDILVRDEDLEDDFITDNSEYDQIEREHFTTYSMKVEGVKYSVFAYKESYDLRTVTHEGITHQCHTRTMVEKMNMNRPKDHEDFKSYMKMDD